MLERLDFQNAAPAIAVLVGLGTVLLIAQGVWRVYFSPISKFPGPKLAALTYWYEFYYDIILGGKYIFKIRELHKQYGPILRINPHELHVIDPAFFDVLYAGGSHRRDRDRWHSDGMAVRGSILATPSHDLHRKRRAALKNFFSKASARNLQPVIMERVDMLIKRLVGLKDTGKVVNLLHALSALSNDIITGYCFGDSDHRLEDEEFDISYYKLMMGSATSLPLMIHFPLLPKLLLSLPDFLTLRMGDEITSVIKSRKVLSANLEQVKNPTKKSDLENKTVFHALLKSHQLPESEKSDDRLVDEAVVLIGAGSHTASWAMTVACFHVLSNPSILQNLKEELHANKERGHEHSLPDLEKLPYLTGVVKEGLRLAYGTSSRVARIAPDEALRYQNWVIPKGTSVSMTAVLIHQNEDVFPQAASFRPERWLEDTTGKLDKHLASFNAGSMICLGMNLAWAELYLSIAAIFGTFGGNGYRSEGDEGILDLFGTGLADVEIQRDKFFPVAEKGSKGVRVMIRS